MTIVTTTTLLTNAIKIVNEQCQPHTPNHLTVSIIFVVTVIIVLKLSILSSLHYSADVRGNL